MEIFYINMLNKLFVLLYSFLLIYGLYFDYKEKKVIANRIKNKIDNNFMTELVLEIDEDEKYMLKRLSSEYGYSSIEEYIVSKINYEIEK